MSERDLAGGLDYQEARFLFHLTGINGGGKTETVLCDERRRPMELERRSVVLTNRERTSRVKILWCHHKGEPWRPRRLLRQLRKWGWCYAVPYEGTVTSYVVNISITLIPADYCQNYRGTVIDIGTHFIGDFQAIEGGPISFRTYNLNILAFFRSPSWWEIPMVAPPPGSLLVEYKREKRR